MIRRLAIVIPLGLLVGATAVWAQSRFSDVPDTYPYSVEIDYAAERGWFVGYPDGTFRPDQTLTAIQAATVFGRVFPDGVTRSEFARFLYVVDQTPPPTATTATTVWSGLPTAPTNPTMSVTIPNEELPQRRKLWIWWDDLDEMYSNITEFLADKTPERVQHWHVQVRRDGTIVADDPDFPLITAHAPYVVVGWVALGDGSYDIPGGVYQFRVAAVNGIGRGAWSVWSDAVEVPDPPPFTPPVASPFTITELDYLDALAVAGFNSWFEAEPVTRVSAEGIDRDGAGRTDIGWDNLDRLATYTTAILLGENMCDTESWLRFVSTGNQFMNRDERERFATVARAYLC